MRKTLIRLLFFVSVLISPIAYSLSKAQLDKKYGSFELSVDWNQRLESELDAPVLEFLNNGRFQEAIWLLEDAQKEDSAKKLKKILYDILRGPIYSDGVLTLGGGVTETKLVYLQYGVKAVLKPESRHPSSNYLSEIGAYLVDQMGKFALVPMTIYRYHDGKISSLQYFVEGAHDATKEENYMKSANLNVFDYLIYNQDRTVRNVIFANGREIAIDHGLALRPNSWLGNFLRLSDKTRDVFGIDGDPIRMKMMFQSQ
jgi:hypothetical protein